MKFDMKLKSRKTKTTDRKRLIKQLDTLVSVRVRERDKVCRYCGKSHRTYCHHILSRRHMGVRFELENCVSLCFYCHRAVAHGDPVVFLDWVKTWMSEDMLNRLKVRAYAKTKFTVSDLEWLKKDMAA